VAEPSLSLAYFDYRAEVGAYLGYGRGDEGGNTDPAWTDSQTKTVNQVVAAGQRQFYYPPPLEGERHAHEWSFLRPWGTVAIASGDSEVTLPSDFGGIDGDTIVVTQTGTTTARTLTLAGVGVVRAAQEGSDATGTPQMVALEPLKERPADASPRWKLVLWPESDDDYTLKFRYVLLPDAITGARPYSYGGQQHVETVLAACLERAEFYKDNARGVCWANWQDRLSASVSIDRRMRPVSLGMNTDPSSGPTSNDYWQTVTWNGVTAENT
jgi:hypothetical protein